LSRVSRPVVVFVALESKRWPDDGLGKRPSELLVWVACASECVTTRPWGQTKLTVRGRCATTYDRSYRGAGRCEGRLEGGAVIRLVVVLVAAVLAVAGCSWV